MKPYPAKENSLLQNAAVGLALVAYLCLLLSLGAAVWYREVAYLPAGMAALISAGMVWFFLAFVESIDCDGGPRFESHWGGLGGGAGGWRCTPSTVHLVSFLSCGLILVLLTYPLVQTAALKKDIEALRGQVKEKEKEVEKFRDAHKKAENAPQIESKVTTEDIQRFLKPLSPEAGAK